MEKIKLRDSIERLKELGYNVPEILLSLPQGVTEAEKERWDILGIAMCRALRDAHTTATARSGQLEYPPIAYTPSELSAFLDSWKYTEDLCVMKYPRTTSLCHGRCTPGPHFNRYEIFPKGPNFSVPWGATTDLQGKISHDIELRKVVDRINSLMAPHKSALDGFEVEFSVHVGSEGLNRARELFWGYRSKNYGY